MLKLHALEKKVLICLFISEVRSNHGTHESRRASKLSDGFNGISLLMGIMLLIEVTEKRELDAVMSSGDGNNERKPS